MTDCDIEYAEDVEAMRSPTRLSPAGTRAGPVQQQRQRLLQATAAAG